MIGEARNVMAERRYGRFALPMRTLMYDQATAFAVLRHVLVTQCRFNARQGYYEYEGASLLFRPLPREQAAPWYELEVEYAGDNAPLIINATETRRGKS